MTEISLGSYRLLVDVEGTRAYYQAHPLPWVTCTCAGCRNFLQAVRTASPEVTAFLRRLGLEAEKAAEVCVDWGDAQGCLYGVWYHLQGQVLSGGPKMGHRGGEWLPIAEGASFSPECYLLPQDFPRPAIQLDLEWRLPWLLPEENPYQ